ncbi:GNAT family N-acetyltransferase [Streptomyces sp. NPDC000941]
MIGVVTDPAYRRRGHSRAIMRGLLAWFRERGVARVDLHASAEGELPAPVSVLGPGLCAYLLTC